MTRNQLVKCVSYVFILIMFFCRNDGFLKSIQSVKFRGVSRDPVSFDSNGNGLGAYDITVVNTTNEQWEPIGSWISNTSNVLDLPANVSFLDLNLAKLRMFWQKVFDSSIEPTSFCGQQCPPGHLMLADERHQVILLVLVFVRILQWLALHTYVSSLPRDSSEAFQLTRQTSRLKSR